MSLAFVFPGQGSQSLGMAGSLIAEYPVVAGRFQQAADVLGYDLVELIENGPESELNKTEKTQPALLATSCAIWDVWQQLGGPQPLLMAGHSLGEYSALVCSGALSFPDAISLVADRGRYMQAAVPEGEGRMAAILGLDEDTIIDICNEISNGEIVSAANFNSIGQVVIAGHSNAVDAAVHAADEAGAMRSVLLPVSIPSHCILMKGASEKLLERLQDVSITTGNIPVIHNVDATTKDSPDDIRQALVEQLYQPVRWIESVQRMSQQGISRIIECGPGNVLCGLIRRIDRKIATQPVYDPATIESALSG